MRYLLKKPHLKNILIHFFAKLKSVKYMFTRITLDKSSPKGRNYLFFIQVSESNEMKIFSNIHHGIVLKEINSLSRRFFNFYKPKLLRNCQ